MNESNYPLITVVIPVYNSEKYISSAIESVLTQTYQNFEIIIINDGSTDNTKRVIESFNDSRIKYIEQKNAGPAAARNKGLENAIGEYIAFLDADDLWKPEKLELQINVFKGHDDICLTYSALEVLSSENILIELHSFKNYKRMDLVKFLLFDHIAIMPAVMIKKTYLDEVGYFNPGLYTGEDWDLWLRLALKANFFYTDKILVTRYRPITSITNSIDYSITKKCHLEVCDNFFNIYCKDKEIQKLKKQAYSFLYYDLSRIYFYKDKKNPDMKKVLNYFFISIKYAPIFYLFSYERIRYLIRIMAKLVLGL